MATKQEAREHIIDLILNYILNNATKAFLEEDGTYTHDPIDLTNYRRYIDPNTGQITVGTTSTDSNLVLYEKDFRESFDQSLINVVNEIINNCGTETAGEYDLGMFTSNLWEYIPGGTDCDDFPGDYGGISFSGDGGQLDGSECPEVSGTMACGENLGDHVINLLLTENVLASLSQFITIIQQQTDINELADEVLDTNIYELLPGGLTIQEQISKFFADYNRLKGTPPPIVPIEEDPTLEQESGFIDEDGDGTPDGWSSTADETTYTTDHDVSDDGLTGNISRLDGDAPTGFDNQTLQWLRDDLNTFLYDVDYDPVTAETDTRPDYENQSGGYLKFRGLNQGIIVRSTEGTDVGLNSYRVDGFTITMWVRFLDKVSTGTLFNYGNPLRGNNPTGFKLETLIDPTDLNYRYIRLVLRDGNGADGGLLRDSHVGITGTPRIDTTSGTLSNGSSGTLPPTNVGYTKVPIDFSEWFFIVASFNPNVTEEVDSELGSSNLENEDFWRNNVDENGYTASSNLGAMCKVEVISKSDLLRARGFKV